MSQTIAFVQLQTAAISNGAPGYRFEVGVYFFENERMSLRTWDQKNIMHSLGWLRWQNMRGGNIYIRPSGEHQLSLVDDLSFDAIRDMQKTGFTPALVVQTSNANFQAWLQHGKVLSSEMSTAVAKALAARFGGDHGSADWRHFGRLAGFTNKKEKHRKDDGHFPFVRVIEGTGTGYPRADTFLEEVRKQLEGDNKRDKDRRAAFRLRPRKREEGTVKSILNFREDPRYRGAASRSDMAYAIYALDHGKAPNSVADEIDTGLEWRGSSARRRDYVNRIIRKAESYLSR